MPLRTIARCLRGMASMFDSSSGSSGLRKVKYRSCCGQSSWRRSTWRSSRCWAPSCCVRRAASASSALAASGVSAATPPYTANGRLTTAWPNSMLLTCASGSTPSMRPARSAYSRYSGWWNTRSSARAQPARWKKLACGQACTKASQRAATAVSATDSRLISITGLVVQFAAAGRPGEACGRKMSSMRPQRKSRSNASSRCSVRPMFT